jgi:hypothetical protein
VLEQAAPSALTKEAAPTPEKAAPAPKKAAPTHSKGSPPLRLVIMKVKAHKYTIAPPLGGSKPNNTLALHIGKGATHAGPLMNPKLGEGHISVKTMSGHGLGSLK